MAPEEYERQDIEVLNEVAPYGFESDREEQWFKVGLQYGLDAADKEPLIHWISVKDDFPCNHEDLLHPLYANFTKDVLVIFENKYISLERMIKDDKGNWKFVGNVLYWMPIPELPKERRLNYEEKS